MKSTTASNTIVLFYLFYVKEAVDKVVNQCYDQYLDHNGAKTDLHRIWRLYWLSSEPTDGNTIANPTEIIQIEEVRINRRFFFIANNPFGSFLRADFIGKQAIYKKSKLL